MIRRFLHRVSSWVYAKTTSGARRARPTARVTRLSRAGLFVTTTMTTPFLVGVGAIAAAVAGRSLLKRGLLGSKGAAEQWVKGGFKAKMDRKEAIAILGLK